MKKARHVTGHIIYPDGSTHQFSIMKDAGYQQWGASPSELVERGAGDMLEAMADVAAEFMVSDADEEDEVDDPGHLDFGSMIEVREMKGQRVLPSARAVLTLDGLWTLMDGRMIPHGNGAATTLVSEWITDWEEI